MNSVQVVPLADVGQVLPLLADERWPALVIDVETTGVEPYLGDRPFGLGVAPFGSGQSFYFPLPAQLEELPSPLLKILAVRPLMGHNLKFDLHNIALLGWEPQQERLFDVLPLARIWAPEEMPQLGLKELGGRLFGFSYSDPEALAAAKKGKLQLLPAERQAAYNNEDLWLTEQVYRWLKANLQERHLQLYARESELTRDLYDIERRGQLIDQTYLGWLAERVGGQLAAYLGPIQEETGDPTFNPKSPKQVRALMERLEVAPIEWTPKGAPSWGADELVAVAGQHPIALQLARYNVLRYVESNMINRCRETIAAGFDGLHGTLQNWGTCTGRLSSSHPNRQNDPHGWLQLEASLDKPDEVLQWARGPEREISIERLFIPRPGYGIATADARQIEMYVLGFYIKDPVFNSWLASGNVHRAAAQEIWGDGEKYYDLGKIYNFATVYGQGDKARADSLGLVAKHEQDKGHRMAGYDCTDCRYDAIAHSAQYRREYSERMPGHRRFQNKVQRLLRRDGYVTNVFGRDYRIDESRAYVAVNYLVQGSSGDHIKFKLPETRALRRQLGIHVLKTTHDDFAVEFPLDRISDMPEFFEALRPSPFGRKLDFDIEWTTRSMAEMEPWTEEAYACKAS